MDNKKDFICCWSDLIYGKACCAYNVLFCPIITCGWAWYIYVGGCLKVCFNRFFHEVCCFACRALGWYWLFTDERFPPNDESLGDVGGDTANVEAGKNDAKIEWVRANGFPVKDGKMQLFDESIDSRDICQGALGDCWLLAAIACIVEHRGVINSVFKSKERNPRGKYRLRLYDGVEEKWEHITIDDYIPCQWGTPMFAQPNGNELYAMLLEKAFAKFCGSYAALEGGYTIWAVRAMTGDPARCFMKEDGGWKRYDLVNVKHDSGRRASELRGNGETLPHDVMFEVLLKYDKLNSILSASGNSGKDGLHTGHAYSILEVKKVSTGFAGFIGGETFKLIKVRNPWGTGEWNGDWSDQSDLWSKYPSVAHACCHKDTGDTDDGAFWMSWDDYVKNWEMIGVVDRTIDITSLGLIVWSNSIFGPISACAVGCLRFWCFFEGMRRLYFPHRSSEETVKVGGCCGFRERHARLSNETE